MEHITEKDVTRALNRALSGGQIEVFASRAGKTKAALDPHCRARIVKQVLSELADLSQERERARPVAGALPLLRLHVPPAELAA